VDDQKGDVLPHLRFADAVRYLHPNPSACGPVSDVPHSREAGPLRPADPRAWKLKKGLM
jgi:hypothetical protein